MTRPSTYDPEYCEMVVNHCAEGGSLTSFAGVVRTTLQTMHNWQRQFPEFALACETAKHLHLAAVEKDHWQACKEGRKTSGHEFRMGNLSAWREWRFKTSNEVTGPNDGPVETLQRIERVIIDPTVEN